MCLYRHFFVFLALVLVAKNQITEKGDGKYPRIACVPAAGLAHKVMFLFCLRSILIDCTLSVSFSLKLRYSGESATVETVSTATKHTTMCFFVYRASRHSKNDTSCRRKYTISDSPH